MILGKNIRYLRKQKDMSQERLAELLGYKSFTTIQKWESGVAEPPFKTLVKIAELFRVDVDTLASEDLSIDNSTDAATPDIGQKIKNRRKELGYTQSDLAKKLGYKDKSAISKIESGTIDLTRDKIIEFANALKMSPLDLLDIEQDYIVKLNDDVEVLIEYRKDMSDKTWNRLKRYAELLLDEQNEESDNHD